MEGSKANSALSMYTPRFGTIENLCWICEFQFKIHDTGVLNHML